MVVYVSQNNKFITINGVSFVMYGSLSELWLRLHQVKTRCCQFTYINGGVE